MQNRFVFSAVGYRKPVAPLTIQFSQPRLDDPVVASMLAEGKIPLPEALQRLSRDQLANKGYPFIRYSRKYGKRYLPITTHKRYDS